MGNSNSKPPGEAPASPSRSVKSGHTGSRSSTLDSKLSQSRQKPPVAEHAAKKNAPKTNQASTSPTSPTTSTRVHHKKHIDSTMGNAESIQAYEAEQEARRSKPQAVPRQRGPDSQFDPIEPSGPPGDPNFIPHSNFGPPPRLPLPIGEEVHTPGSPIIGTKGGLSTLYEDDILEGQLPRQSSTISNTTLEDDEYGSDVDSQAEDSRVRVPYAVHWKQPGEKVYITGTFTGWNRKFRLEKDLETGHLSAKLQLPLGTHHVKFIIDGIFRLSDELPTAVDYTNVLVNYIEVSADDIPHDKEKNSEEELSTPQVLPSGTEVMDHDPGAVADAQLTEGEPVPQEIHWGRTMPQWIKDLDKPEGSNKHQRALNMISTLPPPPSLPKFLEKSILNGTHPMKDDSSVLSMPSHTVLNHLATSNIKNDTLATSTTTRYMKKYVTTVLYKPTDYDVSDDEDEEAKKTS